MSLATNSLQDQQAAIQPEAHCGAAPLSMALAWFAVCRRAATDAAYNCSTDARPLRPARALRSWTNMRAWQRNGF